MRRILAFVVVMVVAPMVACGKPRPPADNMLIAGSANALQAFDKSWIVSPDLQYPFAGEAGYDLEVLAYPYRTAAEELPAIQAVVASEEDAPAVFVMAYGTDEADPYKVNPYEEGQEGVVPGWNVLDKVWVEEAVNAPHASACVIVVLPFYGAATPADYRAELVEARIAMTEMVQARGDDPGRTVIADWQDEVDAHPEWVENSYYGTHIANYITPLEEAVLSFRLIVAEAVLECEEIDT